MSTGFFPGRRFTVAEIPRKYQGTRVRWTLHPEKSMSGPCEECRELAGQFMSIEEGTGLQPVHVNCVCSLKFEPAPGVESNYQDYSLQARNPELWNKAVRHKHESFTSGGHSH